jgi:putative tryptophan/tyrosine transport system substrate-binding protein
MLRAAIHNQAMARLFGAFFGELRLLGYVEGKNVVVERYFGGSLAEIYRDVVSDVVRRNPDLIYAVGPDIRLV